MITEVAISNFKGIKECKVEDLRRVNLFIGKNDSCKSSILEAIFHTIKEYMEDNLWRIMSRRTNVFTGGRELWYAYNTKSNITTSVKFGKIDLALEIAWTPITTEFNQINTILTGSSPQGAWSFNGAAYIGTDFSLRQGSLQKIDAVKVSIDERMKLVNYIRNVALIDCTWKSNMGNLEGTLGQIKLARKDREFGITLKSIYGTGEEWEFLPHPDRSSEMRVAIKEADRRLFLSGLGDGFRYGLVICANAIIHQGTGLFIEEIESHQHYGSLRNLVSNLIDISRKNDLQLFITTHSYDAWNCIARGAYLRDAKRMKEEFRCFLVERDDASGNVSATATDNVQRIVEELGRT
jgi:hypothetical protein